MTHHRAPLARRSLTMAATLAASVLLAACGTGPAGSDKTEEDFIAYRKSQDLLVLQQQISPPLDAPLKLLESPEPRYPSYLITMGIKGNVVVAFEVLPSGHVGDAKVLPGTDESLNKPVLDALRRWRFDPPKRDGKAVRLQLKQTFKMAP
ncbi:MAG: energy transducer TonB [Comamonadaceae bacterium]|nr:MAG: energy transducer TonB [Comamonadaceae bacterium]